MQWQITHTIFVALGISVVGLMVRCRLGWHGHTMMERAKKDDGRDDPYRVEWRCERCGRIVGETVAKPNARLMLSLHRDKRLASEDGRAQARVLPMRNRA